MNSNKNVWYILDDSRITYEENSDFKLICLEKFLKLTLTKDRKVWENAVRKAAIEIFLPLAVRSIADFDKLSEQSG